MNIQEELDKFEKELHEFNNVGVFELNKEDLMNSFNELKATIYDTRCSLQLLCIDKAYNYGLTKGNEYKCIKQNNSAYKIENDLNDEIWYPKEYFKKIK